MGRRRWAICRLLPDFCPYKISNGLFNVRLQAKFSRKDEDWAKDWASEDRVRRSGMQLAWPALANLVQTGASHERTGRSEQVTRRSRDRLGAASKSFGRHQGGPGQADPQDLRASGKGAAQPLHDGSCSVP